MFRRILIFILGLSIAHAAYAQSAGTVIDKFCSVLIDKDITSIRTRAVLMPFFVSENDLSNFIVYMNVKMEKAGFKRFTVYSCTPKSVKTNGLNAGGELEITGEGPLFFVKKHVLVSTVWVNKDGQWYVESPPVINTDK